MLRRRIGCNIHRRLCPAFFRKDGYKFDISNIYTSLFIVFYNICHWSGQADSMFYHWSLVWSLFILSLFTGHCSLWFVVCALCFVDWCYSSCACSDHYRFVQFAHSSLFTVDCSLCFVICALYNVDRCYCYSACSDHYRFVRMSPAALLVPLRSQHVPVLVSTLTARLRKGVSGRWFCVISRYFQSSRDIPASLDVAYPVFIIVIRSNDEGLSGSSVEFSCEFQIQVRKFCKSRHTILE